MKRYFLGVLLALPLSAQAATPEQRGFQVYRQVCSTCHSLNHVTFADLSGIGLAVPDIKAYAASRQVPDGLDDDGDPKTRAAHPSDPIGSPYPNDAMARLANHGDLPPDFSRLAMTEEGGAKRIETILRSYAPKPSDVVLAPGSYYNTAFAQNHIGMPPPLHDGQVTYADGTKATIPQMAQDVGAFLDWVAHPHREARSHTGLVVLIYLAGLGTLLALLKRRVWKRVKETRQ
ncbi:MULTISPECIES: cytochrome c1 [Asaia]|uniref:cytochrome c1 n=1 Tax=Asaia TaxID=91914 RepID=UPI002FC2CB2C